MLIFICDDDRQELKAMEAHLAKAAAELSADVEIAAYTSGESLVKAVEEGACPALAVLDIYMEGMNGVETGCSLRRLHPDVFVAFLTASRDFAVDAFELDALHYMVKPVTTDMFCALLTRLMARMNRSVQVLELPIGRGEKVRFPIEKINRIISKNRGVEISVQGRSSTWLPCLIIQSSGEEVLCRGFLMNGLASKHSWAFAAFGNAVVFGAIHLANPGVSPLAVINVTIAGIFFSVITIRYNLWVSCGVHAMWNFSEGFIFGSSISGNAAQMSAFAVSPTNRPAWLTGGEFGIEGSIVVTVIYIIGIVLIMMIPRASKNKGKEN